MKILTIANQKGGVGKSADTCQLAYYLHSLGLSVLVSDLDHQMHTTKPITKSKKALICKANTFDLLSGSENTLLYKKPNFILIPGSPKLNLLDREKALHNDYITNLHNLLNSLADDFDICLIDTNPNPDIRLIAALSVATHVLSPIQLNQESIDGLTDFLNHPHYGLNNIKQKLNKSLKFVGALPSMVQGSQFQKDNFEAVKTHLKHYLIKLTDNSGEFAYIPHSVAIAEAQQAGLALFEMKKTSARKAWQTTKQAFDAIMHAVLTEK